MDKTAGFIVALEGQEEYLVALGTESPVKLTVVPLAIEDGRAIFVIEERDTVTKEVSHSVLMPDEMSEKEYDLWEGGVSVASVVMAGLEGLIEAGVFSEDGNE